MYGIIKVQNSAATEKPYHLTAKILVIKPVIEYKNGSTNLIADSLSRLRMDEHYKYNTPLENNEPIYLEDCAEISMVQTHAKTVEQENVKLQLPELQVRVRDIFRYQTRGSS